MPAWQLPPIAKIYEAISAIADNRVAITGPHEACVTSSSGAKCYTVRWSDDRREFTADDSASFWQGYTGYPIIAVLLALGEIPYDPALARPLAGVPWKALNVRFKRDYGAAVDSVLGDIPEAAAIRAEAARIYTRLAELNLRKPERKKTK